MPVAGIDTAIGESLFLDDQTGHQPDDDPFPTIQYLLPSCLLSTRSMTEMEMRASSYHRSKPIQWWPGSLGLMLSIYFHIMSTGIDDNMERIGWGGRAASGGRKIYLSSQKRRRRDVCLLLFASWWGVGIDRERWDGRRAHRRGLNIYIYIYIYFFFLFRCWKRLHTQTAATRHTDRGTWKWRRKKKAAGLYRQPFLSL